nr:MAG TPA: chitin synthase regulator [Caudoviricetes sp.]
MKCKREEIIRWCMLAGILLVLMLILFGCGTRRKTLPSQSEVRRDSVYTKVVERTVYKRDTVRINVPQQVAVAKVKDSTSRLENDWSVSTAHVYANGTLWHELKTKAGPRPIETETPIVYRDSIVYRDREVRKTEVREVEKPLGKWQKRQIAGFWVLAVAGLGYVGVKTRRVWLPLVRRFI